MKPAFNFFHRRPQHTDIHNEFKNVKKFRTAILMTKFEMLILNKYPLSLEH